MGFGYTRRSKSCAQNILISRDELLAKQSFEILKEAAWVSKARKLIKKDLLS